MPSYPTYRITTHQAAEGDRYQAAVVERETGREVHRTAWHDGEQPAEDAAYEWLYEERKRQALEAFGQAEGTPCIHLIPRKEE